MTARRPSEHRWSRCSGRWGMLVRASCLPRRGTRRARPDYGVQIGGTISGYVEVKVSRSLDRPFGLPRPRLGGQRPARTGRARPTAGRCLPGSHRLPPPRVQGRAGPCPDRAPPAACATAPRPPTTPRPSSPRATPQGCETIPCPPPDHPHKRAEPIRSLTWDAPTTGPGTRTAPDFPWSGALFRLADHIPGNPCS